MNIVLAQIHHFYQKYHNQWSMKLKIKVKNMSKINSKFLVSSVIKYESRATYNDYHMRKNTPKRPRRPFLPILDMNPGDRVNVIFADNEEDFNRRFTNYMSYIGSVGIMLGIRLKKKKYFFPGHVHEYGITVTHDGFYELED